MSVKLVGILNITPDSFSDGGKFNNLENALNQTQKLIDQGADIIDIGAESTRPNAKAINHAEEWKRLENILSEIINLCHKNNIQISLDSRHYQTIQKALGLGIDVINDVSGFEDKKIVDLAKKSAKKIVVMHNLGVPAQKNVIIDENLDEISEIKNWAINKINYLEKSGIKKENIIFDVGIGFGKNAKQSINILENINKFKDLGVKIYVGHSRKSFLNEMKFDEKDLTEIQKNNPNIDEKDLKTILISRNIALQGVDYLRIHDILGHSNVLK